MLQFGFACVLVKISTYSLCSTNQYTFIAKDVWVVGLPPLRKRGRKRKAEVEERTMGKEGKEGLKMSVGWSYKIGKDRSQNHYYT